MLIMIDPRSRSRLFIEGAYVQYDQFGTDGVITVHV